MASRITWQIDSNHPKNADYFTLISQWWEKLDAQEVSWQQRLITESETVDENEWATQRFDEKFKVIRPQIRGITFYWYPPNSKEERSITPRKLSFDVKQGLLDIYPQNQPQLVIRVTKTQIIYQNIEVKNPLIVGNYVNGEYVLLLRDKPQKLQVKITLNSEHIQQLLDSLPKE